MVGVYPDVDLVVLADDAHGVPLAEGFLRIIGEVPDVAFLTLLPSPIAGVPVAALGHVLNLDVLADAPEVPCAARLQLALDRLGKHVIEHARLGCVYEDTAIASLVRPTVLDDQFVIAERVVCDEVAPGRSVAQQDAVGNAK